MPAPCPARWKGIRPARPSSVISRNRSTLRRMRSWPATGDREVQASSAQANWPAGKLRATFDSRPAAAQQRPDPAARAPRSCQLHVRHVDRSAFAADVERHLGRRVPAARIEQCDHVFDQTRVPRIEQPIEAFSLPVESEIDSRSQRGRDLDQRMDRDPISAATLDPPNDCPRHATATRAAAGSGRDGVAVLADPGRTGRHPSPERAQ